jgi:hypothetical protein
MHGKVLGLFFYVFAVYIDQHMGKRIPSRPVLFLIFLFCTTGWLSALSLGITGWGDIVVTSVTGAPIKAQPGLGASLTVSIPFFDLVGPGFSLLLSNVWPSDAGGWVIVRGYSEVGLSGFVLGQAKVLSLPGIGDFRAGGRAGMSASIAGYPPSTLVFFMPSVDFAGFLTWTPEAIPNWDFSITVPLRIMLRPDVAFSGSFGLELGVAFSPDPSRQRTEVGQ